MGVASVESLRLPVDAEGRDAILRWSDTSAPAGIAPGTHLGSGHEGPFTPSNQEAEEAPMKIRAIRISMLCALLVALVMASTASAQSSPDQTVYNPNGEVLNVVSGGG